MDDGKNSQIPLFFEIISVLPLFKKYVAKYNFFELKFVKLEFDMKLEFIKIEAVFVLCEKHFRKCFSIFTGIWLRTENAFSGNAFQLACVGV